MATDSLPPVLPRAVLFDEISAAAAARAAVPDFPTTKVQRIRAAALGFAAGDYRPHDLRHSALLLERQATIDLQVPTASRVPGLTFVKRVIKKLMMWYLRFLGHQISAFGLATARFGVTVANRMDTVDAEVAELQARVGALEARLDDPPNRS
ncbi:MAG: hypothetical protein M3Q68_09535 [Actinomycetota bacterium]|nr:hypothetical protein [Actinomycetota bacterium]